MPIVSVLAYYRMMTMLDERNSTHRDILKVLTEMRTCVAHTYDLLQRCGENVFLPKRPANITLGFLVWYACLAYAILRSV